MFDLIIIGAGPAGLSAAREAKKKQLNYLLIEKEEIANTICTFPKGKTVQYYPANVEVIGDFPLPAGTPRDVVDSWQALAKDLNVKDFEEVTELKKEDSKFMVKTNKETYESKFVIVAIGVQGSPRKLDIDCDCKGGICYKIPNPKEFTGKKIIVVGGGDTAIEHAVLLKEAGAEVIISYRKPEFFRLKEVNEKAIDEHKIPVIFNSIVKCLKNKKAILTTAEGEKEIEADMIAVFAGTIPAVSFLEKIGLELESNKPIYNPETFESNVKGMYIAGDLTKQPLIKHAINHGVLIVDEIKKKALNRSRKN